MEQNAGRERRKWRRIHVNCPIDIIAVDGNRAQQPLKAHALNVSREGVCLRAHVNAGIGSRLFLSLQFGGRESLFLAEVVWQSNDSKGQIFGMHIRQWTYLDGVLEKELIPEPQPTSPPKAMTSQMARA